jgi:hypothetical protein
MGMQGYALFVRLLNMGHDPAQMGLKATAGDVARWSSRVKLARNFRGLQIEGCSEHTLAGYSAFFQVFLTHSALERYLAIVGLSEDDLNSALFPDDPHESIRQFFAMDRSGKLFNFLHSRLKSKARNNLTACRDGTCGNVAFLSASVRHIFVHGHLAANSHDVNPKQVARACNVISAFLLKFMEYDFSRRVGDYYHSVARRQKSAPPGGQPSSEPDQVAERGRRTRPVPQPVVQGRSALGVSAAASRLTKRRSGPEPLSRHRSALRS